MAFVSKLQLDILKRHTGPFLFCFLTIMFLLLMQFLIQFIEHLVGKDIPLLVIFELIATNLAYMVVLAVPMAVLVATLIAFGKFAENSELAATKAAGINPIRLILPVIAVAALLSVFLMWFSNEVLPEANYKARALFIDIRMKKPGFDLRENEFYDGLDGYTFLVREVSAADDSLFQITLFQDASQNRDRAVIKADRGFLESNEELMLLTLHLENGTILRHLSRSGTRGVVLEETSFDRYRISFDISDLSFSRTNPERRRRDGRTMRIQAMRAVIDSLQAEKNHEIEQYIDRTANLHVRSLHTLPTDVSPQEEEDLLTYGAIDFQDIPERNTFATIPPIETNFFTLNQLQNLSSQTSTAQQGLLGFRNTLSRLENLSSSLTWRSERIASFAVEIHKKISLPVACIIFALVGAPLGMLTKKGNLGVNALIATVLFTFYWISIIQGEKLADRLIISPFTGMWFANILLFILGLILMARISREYLWPGGKS